MQYSEGARMDEPFACLYACSGAVLLGKQCLPTLWWLCQPHADSGQSNQALDAQRAHLAHQVCDGIVSPG